MVHGFLRLTKDSNIAHLSSEVFAIVARTYAEVGCEGETGTHIGEDASGMANDNRRRENPDTPAKEEDGRNCGSTMD